MNGSLLDSLSAGDGPVPSVQRQLRLLMILVVILVVLWVGLVGLGLIQGA